MFVVDMAVWYESALPNVVLHTHTHTQKYLLYMVTGCFRL